MVFPSRFDHLIRENEPLAPYCWLRLGGPARYFAEPTTIDEFCGLVQEADQAGVPVRILGDGSNILVRETGVDGLVIHTSAAELSSIEIEDQNKLIAGSGAKLSQVISRAIGCGLAGLEHLAGIPGTVGGAVVGNAGTTNDDLGSRVSRLRVINAQGELETRDKSQLQFGYRRSNLDGAIVVQIELQLEAGDIGQLTRRMQADWIIKRRHQPPAGTRCVQAFIEPSGITLGELFESSAVKGTSEAGVQLSVSHPGYLVVSEGATSDHVISLMERVRKAVEVQSGISLQSQMKIW